MRLVIALLFVLFFMPCAATKEEKLEFIDFNESSSKDLFATIDDVLKAILYYEAGYCSGISIDFQTHGKFYDPNHGPNWWNYFFEPIFLGDPEKGVPFPYHAEQLNQATAALWQQTPPKKLQRICHQHVKLNAHMKKKIRQYMQAHFKEGSVIGVLYSDSGVAQGHHLPYEDVAKVILNYVMDHKISNYVLLVSTDRPSFLDAMRIRFPNRILTLSAFNERNNPYEYAEKKILECFLLSQTEVLIHTSSPLRRWTHYFNPHLVQVSVSQKRLLDDWR